VAVDRIGQTSHVIAYRLLAKDTIEKKIRLLQKQKHTLATDVLGEEVLPELFQWTISNFFL